MQYEPLLDSEPTSQAEGAEFPDVPTDDPFGPEAREARLSAMMLEVFQGNVQRGRSLKYWENLKLKPVHVQMIVMKAAGYSSNSIAERFGLTPARVSVILNHPDAYSILARLVSFQAESLLDIKARISAHAGEALDTVLQVLRDPTEKGEVRAGVGFKLLDRAGYGAVQKNETIIKIELEKEAAGDLSAAVREAEELDRQDYEVLSQDGKPQYLTGYTGGSGDPEGVEEEAPQSRSAALEPPQTGQYSPPAHAVTRRTA